MFAISLITERLENAATLLLFYEEYDEENELHVY